MNCSVLRKKESYPPAPLKWSLKCVKREGQRLFYIKGLWKCCPSVRCANLWWQPLDFDFWMAFLEEIFREWTNCKCWHRVQVHLDQWVLFLPPLGTRHFHHSSHILRHSPYEHFWYFDKFDFHKILFMDTLRRELAAHWRSSGTSPPDKQRWKVRRWSRRNRSNCRWHWPTALRSRSQDTRSVPECPQHTFSCPQVPLLITCPPRALRAVPSYQQTFVS